MKILDTEVLVSFIDAEDKFHLDGKKHVRAVTASDEVFVPSVSMVELDLVLKQRKIDGKERAKIFNLLAKPIPSEKVLPVTAQILEKAARLNQKATWRHHYFDVLIAATAQEYGADIVSTDSRISSLRVNVIW